MELKWKPVVWRWEPQPRWEYTLYEESHGASVVFVGPNGPGHSVCAREGENAVFWPSAAMAQLAAQLHYDRMRTTGETPDVAASRIPTDPAWYEAKMGETP